MAETRSNSEDVGGRLRQLRGDRTPQKFANELGISKTDYIDYEAGKREIPASLLIALIQRGSIDPTWVLTGKRIGTVAGSARDAGYAYAAILEAALRAGVTLAPSAFAYAIQGAWQEVSRGREIDPAHADVLVKLATINGNRLP